MVTSTYDPCLLVTTGQTFGLTGMQTDDTLHLCFPEFSATEKKKNQKAGFRSKPKTSLSKSSLLKFNEGRITLLNDHLSLRQKDQGSKLKLVDIKAKDYAQQYLKQRARDAYLASVCQPKAAFDLSAAAQASNPTPENAAALNKRLQ
jgi:ribosomal protein S15P/S13E